MSHPKVKMGGESTYDGKFQVADQALQYTIELIEAGAPGAKIHYYDFADDDRGDYFAKPNIGMGTNLEQVLRREGIEVDWENSMMIGDSEYMLGQSSPRNKAGDAFSDADRMFAFNLRVGTYKHPQSVFGWTDAQRTPIMKHDPKGLAKTVVKKTECEVVLGTTEVKESSAPAAETKDAATASQPQTKTSEPHST